MKSITTPTDIQSLTQDFIPRPTPFNYRPKNWPQPMTLKSYSEWSEEPEAIRLAEEETKAGMAKSLSLGTMARKS